MTTEEGKPPRTSITDDLKPIAQSIGILVIQLGQLESRVAELLAVFLRLPSEEANAVVWNIDFREKLAILRSRGLAILSLLPE